MDRSDYDAKTMNLGVSKMLDLIFGESEVDDLYDALGSGAGSAMLSYAADAIRRYNLGAVCPTSGDQPF